MRLTSLVPFRDGGTLTRPDFGLFGLHREIDRLFSEFAQGVGPSAEIIPNIEISETDTASARTSRFRLTMTPSPFAARRRLRKTRKTRTFSSASAATAYSCACCNCLL